MNNFPKISIITPSFNQGKYIEETILSVINQDYLNIEYLVIDGGSTDNTVDIIKKYENNITYWVSEKDSGQSEAINKGFKKATGDIVCWINSDDILMPDALKTVSEYFVMNQDIDFLNGYTLRIDKSSKILFNHFILQPKKWYAKHGVYYVSQQAMFWRTKVFDEIGYLDETFHARMDQEFLVRLLLNNYKIGFVNSILGAIRIHEDTKTSQNSDIWENDKNELIKRYGDKFKFEYSKIFSCIYGLEKLIKGLYLRQFLFKRKWKGKDMKELSKNYFVNKY
ncbi:MAG TPA: glycosyltransferase family 2 protein [Candidatus Paceibacterota bacterium]